MRFELLHHIRNNTWIICFNPGSVCIVVSFRDAMDILISLDFVFSYTTTIYEHFIITQKFNDV